MIAFLRRIWVFVRPYKTRLILGLLCGILYAVANGALVMIIKAVVNHVFPGPEAPAAAQQLQSAPAAFRPMLQKLAAFLPHFNFPESKSGLVLVIFSLPLVMFVRGVFS